MPNAARLIVLIAACLVAAPSSAQTAANPHGAFVDVLAGPDWDDASDHITFVPGATSRSGLAFGSIREGQGSTDTRSNSMSTSGGRKSVDDRST